MVAEQDELNPWNELLCIYLVISTPLSIPGYSEKPSFSTPTCNKRNSGPRIILIGFYCYDSDSLFPA